MQAPDAAPRAGRDPAQITALLAADDITVGAGIELVDRDGRVLGDLGDALDDGSVSWDGTVDVHRECALTLTAPLAWDSDRVRVYMDLASDTVGTSARWWLGVFILTTPTSTAGGGDARQVSGLDLLHLLSCPIGDTWAVQAGANVLAECRRLVAATSFGPRVFFDSTAQDATFREDMVWPLIPASGGGLGTTTWLQPLGEMLASIGYERPWVDESGAMRARPLVPVAQRPVEFVLDADDAGTTIMGSAERRRTQDLTTIPNAWIFVAKSWDLTPVEGDGLYRPPDNTSVGPTSITARKGHRVVSVVEVDAQTQDALVAQATAAVEADLRAAAARDVEVNPLPSMGHHDLYLLRDAELGAPARAVATHWTVHLSGADGQLTVEEVP